jgi:rRNA-processing protein FCF1
MSDCNGCFKPTKNEALHKATRDIYKVAKKNGWKEAAILERANGTGYILCSSDDERCQRLRIVGYYSLG